ncbi:LysR substrate-binding domain-containing protein [Magnetospira sp. QH-2]|uniref:LysR substrate-binding domain-containing protein n=1 Tax=Magnetospira sp. (strain QH-2) TaxID=1288970 RepID=UPI00208EBE45|nr:LysR substrate-binding domain-containing protein [Magnetospira sp. QH-2]
MFEAEADSLKGTPRGRLTISTVTTVDYFSPFILRCFCERFPEVNVAMSVANREDLLRELVESKVDMAIMGQPPETKKLSANAFLDNPIVIVSLPDHPLANEKDIDITRLADEVFLMREKGSGTRGAMLRFFSEHEIKVKTSLEMSGAESLKQGVLAGLGLAMISRDAVMLEVKTGRLVELDIPGLPILRQWYLVHRATKTLRPPAQAFKDFVLNEGAALVEESR